MPRGADASRAVLGGLGLASAIFWLPPSASLIRPSAVKRVADQLGYGIESVPLWVRRATDFVRERWFTGPEAVWPTVWPTR